MKTEGGERGGGEEICSQVHSFMWGRESREERENQSESATIQQSTVFSLWKHSFSVHLFTNETWHLDVTAAPRRGRAARPSVQQREKSPTHYKNSEVTSRDHSVARLALNI